MGIEMFFWIMSAVGALITILLMIIGSLLVMDRKDIRAKEQKQDDWMLSLQKEVNDNTKQIYALNKIVQVNQQQDSRRMDIIEQTLNGEKIAENIYAKLRAMGG